MIQFIKTEINDNNFNMSIFPIIPTLSFVEIKEKGDITFFAISLAWLFFKINFNF